MKEIKDIIRSYHAAAASGKRMALATVVHVEGSSYRRPGARMLVTDDGQLTGAISGGCLEGDALRKALLAISQQKNKLVTYDTTDESDTTLGVQLGCNGIVHILFEPIDFLQENNPVELLKKTTETRQNAVVITLFSLRSRNTPQPGTCFMHLPKENITVDFCPNPELSPLLPACAQQTARKGNSVFQNFDTGARQLTGFIEFLSTPPSLVIAGAGNDTIPLVEMAAMLGWETTIVDGRAGHATPARFPKANQVLVRPADKVLDLVTIDERTFFLLMTHNYNYDVVLLKNLLLSDKYHYIGSLGPKKKLERMFSDLAAEGIVVTADQRSRIFGPVGLDLGAETSEEIALSVISEIKAVMNKRNGRFLRDKTDPIHARSAQQIEYAADEKTDFLCAIETTAN